MKWPPLNMVSAEPGIGVGVGGWLRSALPFWESKSHSSRGSLI